MARNRQRSRFFEASAAFASWGLAILFLVAGEGPAKTDSLPSPKQTRGRLPRESIRTDSRGSHSPLRSWRIILNSFNP